MLLENPFSPKQGKLKDSSLERKGLPKSGALPNDDEVIDPNNPKKGKDAPLLDFAELWQPNVDKDGKPIKKAGPKTYMPSLDPKAMSGFLDKMDFTKGFSPEQLEAVSKGGQEAVVALSQMMNQVGRQAFAAAFTGLNKMAEAGVQAGIADARASIPGEVANMLTDTQLESSNPLMKNPAFAPMVKMIKQQYREKYPKATPQEITESVSAYFDTMYEQIKGTKGKIENPELTNEDLIKRGDAGADWENWFDVEPPALQEATENLTTQQVTTE